MVRRSLHRAGDYEAAWSAMQHVLRQRPTLGVAHAMACRIHIGRGDLAAAHAALAEAERLDPGELRVVLAEAELALAEHTADAEQLVAAVRERATREPFTLLDADFLLPAP